MKTSLKKLQKFAALRYDKRPPKQHQPIALDELARATRDMNDMKNCYDSLLSAAAATANSVYEFSESLREMGDCLLEKTALNDDEESGKVLLMLGKAQFEIQKLVDGYRSHIFRTITVPSESLLNELRIVEEMKRSCDDKREIYEDMKKQKEKGRLKGIKGEGLTTHQLQSAYDEYDEEANMFVFRMKSLKQGQSRSLLTQASRHHAAQLSFFKRSLKSLEGIEPHVRLVAEEQHIDYQFSELMDEDLENYEDGDETDSDEDDDSEDGSETHDGGELSFEHVKNGNVLEASSLKHSIELDDRAATVSPETKPAAAKEHFPSPRRNSFSFSWDVRAISKSAPLFPDKKQLDSTNRLTPLMRSSPSRKFTSYVLPTPAETKGPVSGRLDKEIPQTRRAVSNLWHSSPLTPNKYGILHANDKLSEPIILNTRSVLKESNNNTVKESRLPPPLSEGLSFQRIDPNFASDSKKVKRQAFSGPIMGKTWTNPNNSNFTASGPIASSGYPPRFSGSSLRAPLPQPTATPKMSSGFTPIFVSSPKISELHELPRPPTHIAARKPARSTHSGPLLSQRHELATTALTSTAAASTLPMPPLVLSRSYSIPIRGAMNVVGLHVPLDSFRNTS